MDFKENERIAKNLFNNVGEKLYSLNEINNKIAEREASIGFSDEIKNAGEFGWSELELDSEYINGIEVIHVTGVDELMENLADNNRAHFRQSNRISLLSWKTLYGRFGV